MPRVGARVLVAYLAVQVPGTVIAVDADRRGVDVELVDGERVRFELSRATGTFQAAGHTRARLLFE